jgi:hypothetical protein
MCRRGTSGRSRNRSIRRPERSGST